MTYIPTQWKIGDVIASSRINKIEQGITTATEFDTTLEIAGKPAEAAAAGDKIAEIHGLIERSVDSLYEEISTIETSLQQMNSIVENEILDRTAANDVLNEKIGIIESFDDGSVTNEAELEDIRIKADGTIATSAGDALREQINELKQEIAELISLLPPIITYKTYDGSSVIATEAIYCDCGGTIENTIPREADAQYIYTPNGWSLTPNGAPDVNALTNVVEDRTVYAAYDTVVPE